MSRRFALGCGLPFELALLAKHYLSPVVVKRVLDRDRPVAEITVLDDVGNGPPAVAGLRKSGAHEQRGSRNQRSHSLSLIEIELYPICCPVTSKY
ncbi:hypothetical protein SBA3_100016 [Candidatus Sulfopaludibacter sp. SbA3]|nr:hypothetical protein SBA3_100016 [Candidatus Sulfopaludibacter sp. SbA3]